MVNNQQIDLGDFETIVKDVEETNIEVIFGYHFWLKNNQIIIQKTDPRFNVSIIPSKRERGEIIKRIGKIAYSKAAKEAEIRNIARRWN